MIRNLNPGADVAVVERDEFGEAVDTTRYMFIARANEFVICSAFIYGIDGIDATLSYHAQETADNYDTDLCVFPIEDCYETLSEAKEALALETKTEDENANN